MEGIIATRNRTTSDAMSGLSLNRSDFPGFSDDELVQHFATFNQYDIDSSGFVTAENLLDVLNAMEVPGASIDMVKNIIEEVAILSGHDNDGHLSFRDYMRCIKYDHEAAAHNLALDAEAELRLSVHEEEMSARASMRDEEPEDVTDEAPAPAPAPAVAAPAVEEEPQSGSITKRLSGVFNGVGDGVKRLSSAAMAAPRAVAATAAALASKAAGATEEADAPAPAQSGGRMRQSSMAALATVANARIRNFQQAADAAAAKDKLNAFRSKKAVELGPIVNTENLHMETLRNKVKAFETAARFKGTVEMKKTWKQVGESRNYTAGTKLYAAGAPAKPPPKKKITDLP